MQHISLHQLTSIVKETLSKQLEPSYWVVAEIGELRLNQKGHCYLELIEKDEESGQLLAKSRATIWSYSYRNISAWFESITGESLRAGLTVLANVSVQYHEVYGFSLNIKDIDANFTLGERARKKQEVIQKLQEDGVFEMNKNLPLPLVPQHIAVISAESAAGFGDFMDQINGNSYGYQFQISLFPALMQGDAAPESIMNALISIFNQADNFDAVVLIRGGGAQVDLDCFDHYELASHIAQFPLPIFTGIGHERDETICDLVAHTKLKTPTAVAEFLIRGIRVYEEKIEYLANQLLSHADHQIKLESNKLVQLTQALHYGAKSQLSKADSKTDRLGARLKNAVNSQLKQEESKLNLLERSVELMNPERILQKGYTHTSVNGKPVQSADALTAGDELITHTAEKIIHSTFTKETKRTWPRKK